ncbi:MAG: alkaline phosphatase [bacterium]|jgi:alkaline phosphatase
MPFALPVTATLALLLTLAPAAPAPVTTTTPTPTATTAANPTTASVIFIHPDGASAATWDAIRTFNVGPDGTLHWDRLPHIALYRGAMSDCLTATSNGGATTHATGIKVASDAFGRTAAGDTGKPILTADGKPASVASQALAAGLPVGLVQSGIAAEPGTACFLAPSPARNDYDGISATLLDSGAHVLLSGGERHFLPAGAKGVHGPGARKDGRDLIAEARAKGYVVVRTRAEIAALPPSATRVLGLFATSSTFNDKPEEQLATANLPLYNPDAPTLAEMTDLALTVLQRSGPRFLLVIEEEGTDNFGNTNNAAGVFQAGKRADDAIAVARAHLANHPATLILTTADSDAGGLRLSGIPLIPGKPVPATLPQRDDNGAPIDGVAGARSAPFLAAPDATGRRFPFFVTWASQHDVTGGILVRAEGAHADRVKGSMDNTDIAKLIRFALLGPAAPPAIQP